MVPFSTAGEDNREPKALRLSSGGQTHSSETASLDALDANDNGVIWVLSSASYHWASRLSQFRHDRLSNCIYDEAQQKAAVSDVAISQFIGDGRLYVPRPSQTQGGESVWLRSW